MKFIIVRTTVEAVNATADAIELDAHIPLLDNTKFENFSTRVSDTELVIEVNDEIVLRYLALYAKTYKLIVPMVTAVIGMWNAVQSLIETDCEELIAFITKRKE